MLFGGAAPVRAFDAEYLNGEGMELGYSIILKKLRCTADLTSQIPISSASV